MQLRHHSLRKLTHAALEADVGLAQEALGPRAIEARMHGGDEIQCLRDTQPPRQYGDIGDEAYVAHQLVALGARVAAQYLKMALECRESQHSLQCRGLAGTVRSDEAHDTSGAHCEVHAVERAPGTVCLCQATSFNHCCHFWLPSSLRSAAELPVEAPVEPAVVG